MPASEPLTPRRAIAILKRLAHAPDLPAVADAIEEAGYEPGLHTPWGPLLRDVADASSGAWALGWLGHRLPSSRKTSLVAALRDPSRRREMLQQYHGTEGDLRRSLTLVLGPRLHDRMVTRLVERAALQLARKTRMPPSVARAAPWRLWLARFGREALLDVPVGELLRSPEARITARWIEQRADWTVIKTLDSPVYTSASTWPRTSPKVPPEVREQVRQELRAAIVDDQLAAEIDELPSAPDPQRWPNLAAVATRLRNCLDELEGRVGRDWTLVPIDRTVEVEVEPPALIWRESTRRWDEGRFVVASLGSVLRVELGDGSPAPYRLLRTALRAFVRAITEEHAAAGTLDALEVDLGYRPVDRLLAHLLPSAPLDGSEEVGWGLRDDRDGLWLSPLWCTPRPSGGWKTRLVKVDELDDLVLDADPALDTGPINALMGLYPVARSWSASSLREMLHTRSRVALALDRLRGHPRVFLQIGPDRPLQVRRAELTLSISQGEDGTVELVVAAGGRPLSPSERALIINDESFGAPTLLLDVDPAKATLLVSTARQRRMLHTLGRFGDRHEAAAVDAIVAAVPELQAEVRVSLTDALAGMPVPPDRRLIARLELPADGLDVALWVRPLEGAGVQVPGRGSEVVYGLRDGQRVHARRDLAAERAAMHGLAGDLGIAPPEEGPRVAWQLEGGEAAAACVVHLRERPDVIVEWQGRRGRVAASAGFDKLALRFKTLGEWFGLEGGLAHGDGEVSLEELLLAVEQGRRFVKLGDRDWLELDDALREGLGRAAAALRGGLEGTVSPLHAPTLDELRGAGAEVDAPSTWWEKLHAIDAAAAMTPELPAGLVAELRPYQLDGFRWLARLAEWSGGAVLADDMGLGKTVQALALLLRRAERPALVVAPASVGWNWLRECERFAPSLRAVEYRGPDRAARLADLAPGDLLVTSWDLLARDVDALAETEWGTVVFDEAQFMKNPATRRNRAARRLGAGFRLALTGTPVENHAGELHALLGAVLPGLLGSAASFRQRFLLPLQRGEEPPRRALSRLIAPFVLRRRKAEVAMDLPPRSDIRRTVELSSTERRIYERVRTAGLAHLALAEEAADPQQRMRVLALLTRLRQAACHPRLAEPDSTARSSKTAAVVELLESLREEGHAALVFSQFVGHLELVRDALAERGFSLAWLTGATPAVKRRDEVDRFQAGGVDAFLISIRAGGTGLNLTAASYVVHLDPWWNPAVEDQATDRAHRIGQTRAVTVYRFVAEGTVEEQILELHSKKRELVEGLLAGTGSAKAITTNELVALLTAGGAVPALAEPAAGEPRPVGPEGAAGVDAPPPDAPLDGPAEDASSPNPAPARSWPLLLAALRRDVEATVSRPATARSYNAVGQELVRWFEHDGVADAPWPSLKESVEHLRAAIQDGSWDGPRTPFYQGRLVLKRMRALDEDVASAGATAEGGSVEGTPRAAT